MSDEVMQSSEAVESAAPVSESNHEPVVEESAPVETESTTSDSNSSEFPNNSEVSKDTGTNDNPEYAKRRIERKNKRVQQEIADLKVQVQQLSQGAQYPQAGYETPQAQQAPVAQPGQVIDPFTGQYLDPSDPRYGAALFNQQKEQHAYQTSQEQQRREDQYYAQKQEEKFFDSIDEAASKYEDFDDVVRNDNLPLSEAMLGVAKVSPNGADLLYYLAKNPKEVQRISKLHPRQQQAEVVKHAFKLASKPMMSSAPVPVQPVGETVGQKPMNSFSRVAQSPKDLKAYYREKERSRRK